jgi:peptide deformylase
MLLPIVHFNQPVLRKKGVSVKTFDAGLRTLAANMIETMYAAEGIGLAAQQVGQALQFCVIDLRTAKAEFTWELDGRKQPLDLCMPLALANPKVTVLPGIETSYEEGCLSFPEIRGDVIRPDAARVDFQDADGLPHTLVCTGLLSRCVQHEVDHLNGVLFIDRMTKKVAQELEPALKELKKKTKEKVAAAK